MNKNIEIARQIYDASTRQDGEFILSQLDEDVSWGITSSSTDVIPSHGIFKGKAEVARFFQGWAEAGEFKRFEAKDFVAAGDHVFCTLQYEFEVKATGKRVVNDDCMQHWTFRDGKVVRWRGYEDTAATRQAFLK